MWEQSLPREYPQSNIFQFQQRLSLQLYPRHLSALASARHCRTHNTTEHEELSCLTFLSRVELALQGQIFFWDIPKPKELVQPDIHSRPSSIEEFTRFKDRIENQFGLEEELCLESVLSPWWCRIHRTPHSKFTYSLCMEAANKSKPNTGCPKNQKNASPTKCGVTTLL